MAAVPAAGMERTVNLWAKPRPGSVEDIDYERRDAHDRAIHFRTIDEGVALVTEFVRGLNWADNIIAHIHGSDEEVDFTYLTSAPADVDLQLDLLQGPGEPYPGESALNRGQKVANKLQRESAVTRLNTVLDRKEHRAQAEVAEQSSAALAAAEERRQAEKNAKLHAQSAEAARRVQDKEDDDKRKRTRLAALTTVAQEQEDYMKSCRGYTGIIMLSWLSILLGQVLPASQLRTAIIGWASLAVTIVMALLLFFTDLKLVNSPVAIALLALFLTVIIGGSNLRRDAVLPRTDAAQIEAWYVEMKEIWDALDDRQRAAVPGASEAFEFISDLYRNAEIGPM